MSLTKTPANQDGARGDDPNGFVLYIRTMAKAETETSNYEERLLRLLDGPLPPERADMIRAVVTGLVGLHRQVGVLPDSTPGIRADRDRRG